MGRQADNILLNILANKKIKQYGGYIQTHYTLNKKYNPYFDFDKVWEVIESNKNYLNADPRFDETQLDWYVKKFKEKFEPTVKRKDVDWKEMVIDLMIIMTLNNNLPTNDSFRFN